MMTIHINRAAVEYAKQLVFEGDWALNTVWASAQPSPAKTQQMRDQSSADDFARWYLVSDTDDNGQTVYQFPVGDFRKIHHSAVKAARRYAELNDLPEIVSAADEILDLFDRANAC